MSQRALTGLLRDAGRIVAGALDGGTAEGPWQRWHRVAFGAAPGDPSGRTHVTRTILPAVLSIGPARLTGPLCERIRSDVHLRAATTTRRPGVRIDPGSGRASDEQLRMVEIARGGLPLAAELSLDPLPSDPDHLTALSALIVLATQWCRQLGGGRRRGLGEVAMRVGEHRPEAWAGWLAETGWAPPDPPEPQPPVGDPAPVSTGSAVAGAWSVLEIEVTTEGPVRVPRQVTGNLVRGSDHLPGSLLLPWLSQRWGAGIVRDAVWSGSLVVRAALPEVMDRRGIPAPLTLHRSRDGDRRDLFVGEPPTGSKQVRGAYTLPAPVADGVPLRSPALTRTSHNAIDPMVQRPRSAAGIYELEVIPAGERLHGRVLLAEGLVQQLEREHGPRWWTPLSGPARFGARRRGEYGAATVHVRAPRVLDLDGPAPAECTLWAVTDVLVRGPGLRLSARAEDLRATLARELGVPVVLEEIVARTCRRESWHGGWQLPRESLIGLSAGSVARIAFPQGAPSTARWHAVTARGVGERTVEGYGEVILDAPLLRHERTSALDVTPGARPTAETVADTVADTTADTTAAEAELSGPDRRALTMLRRVVTTERIAHAVPSCRTSPEYRALREAFGELSPSQRGQWRAAATGSAVRGNLGRLRDHIVAVAASGLDRRSAQRRAAELVGMLIGDTEGRGVRPWSAVLAEVGCTVREEPDRVGALAALIADVADDLAREAVQR